MTRTIDFFACVALAGIFAIGPGGASAQQPPRPPAPTPAPRPAPAPRAPEPPRPPSSSSDFDFNFDWNFDFDGIAEAARQTAANIRQQARDFKARGEGRDEARYRQARDLIDNDRYEQALQALDGILGETANAYADAALYWKAYTLARLRRNSDALNALAEMPKRFPQSRWLKDARALEVETRQASGQAVSPDAQDDEELKLLALRGLMRTDPERAMPMVERLMTGNASVKLRDNAMFVLSQSRSPKAREIIVNVAKTGNPDLQMKAIRYLGYIGKPEDQQALIDIYRSVSDASAKRAVIDALAARQSAKTLADLARAEKDPTLKKQIVSRLSMMSSRDATDYLLELFK